VVKRVHANVDVLIGYAAGRLPAGQVAMIAEHMAACAQCAREVAAWQAVARGARSAAPWLEPRRGALAELLDRASADSRRRYQVKGAIRHAVSVVAGQVPLVRRRIWTASVLLLGLGAAIAVTRGDQGGVVLALAAPLVAALGAAVIYGPEVDPGVELQAATPTPARLILIARLVLVAGYDLALTLAASGVVAVCGQTNGLWPVVSGWLGPFTLLCSLSLLLSVWKGPVAGSLTALAVWSLGVLAQVGNAGLSEWQQAVLTHVWTTSVGVLAIGGALTATAVFLAPYQVRLR
jgi:hypothetical protein